MRQGQTVPRVIGNYIQVEAEAVDTWYLIGKAEPDLYVDGANFLLQSRW